MKQSLEFLRERITDKMPLEEMVAIFEDLCREPIEDEMILFETGTFTAISDKPLFQLSFFKGIAETITDTLSISYFPEIKREQESYKLKETDEELLCFDNINFKLAIIQVLMYDLEVLKPVFNIFDFAEEASELNIDTESMEIIQPALDYMINLPIPKKYAEQVQEIDMDGGNEIYMNLIPQWDGEDDSFDLNEVSLKELQQFPNLKKATIMTSNFKQVEDIFKSQGIKVELL